MPTTSSAPIIPDATSSRRMSGFPTLENNNATEKLLVDLMRNLQTGFSNINDHLTLMNAEFKSLKDTRNEDHNRNSMPSHILPSTEQSAPLPQDLPQPLAQNASNLATTVNGSTPDTSNPDDPMSRMERIVQRLSIQVQGLTERIIGLPPSDRNSYNNFPINPVHIPSNVSSYKTWPHKWKIKYDGDNNKLAIELFWNQIIMLKETNDFPWTDVLSSFPNFLEGSAFKWFFRYWRSQSTIHWEKLKMDMIGHFRGDDTDESIRCKLAKRKQGERESFDKFYDSLLDLQDRLTKRLPDKEFIGILQENLRMDIQMCLISFETESLTEFAKKCRYIDKKLHPHSYSPGFNFTKRISEIERDLPEDTISPEIESITARKSFVSNAQTNNQCWNCDKVGHNYIMCEEVRNRFCYWCGYKDVTTRSCPRCNTNFRFPFKTQEPPPSAPPAEDH